MSALLETGIEVKINNDMIGEIRTSDLARDRRDQRVDRFSVGEKVDAKISQIDQASLKCSLSIKALEIEEEKRAMAEYGSPASGASLGEILGAAISEKEGAGQKSDVHDDSEAGSIDGSGDGGSDTDKSE